MRHHWTVRWNLRYILDSTIHTPADKDTGFIWFLVLMNSIWSRAKGWTDLLPGEAFGAGEGKVGMRGLIHDESGEWDRVFDRAQPRYGAASSFGSIHDTGFHLNPPIFIQGGSTARIEKGICFQFPYLFYTHTNTRYQYYYTYSSVFNTSTTTNSNLKGSASEYNGRHGNRKRTVVSMSWGTISFNPGGLFTEKLNTE